MDLSFDRNDVEAVGEGKPWTRREEFDAEIDTDHMGDTASLYARAAHEARSAGELAEVATRMGQEAGARNGQAFVEDERIDVTARGLQGNGEKMDNVVRKIVQAMNLAIDTCEEVDAQIEGGEGMMGMQQILEHNNALAERAWESAQQFFASQPMPDSLNPVVITTGPFNQAPTFTFNNTDYRGVPSGNRWSPPANLPTAIREFYLNQTAELAGQADREITDAIRQYRQRLAEYGAELERDGYDTSEGPLGLWRSEEMAAFNGEEFAKLLRQDHPDQELLARYSAGVNSISEDAQGPNGGRELTPQEKAYLDAFFGKLTTEDLLKVGQLEGDAYRETREAVANGVLAASASGEPLSQVKEFVDAKLVTDSESEADARERAERFNAFGDLMSNATHIPSKEFSTALMDASLTAQNEWAGHRHLTGDPPLEGSPQLLSLAARNDAAAAEYLNDDDHLERLFNRSRLASWADDGQAVGELIRSGTLPDARDYTDAEGFKREARDNLIAFVSDNHEAIKDGTYEIPAPAQLALADVVGHYDYLDNLQADNGGHYPPLSMEGVFSVLMGGDAEAAGRFRDNVDEFIEQKAGSVFRGDPGTGQLRGEMDLLGRLSGAVDNVALGVLLEEDKAHDTAMDHKFKTLQTGLGLATAASGGWGKGAITAYSLTGLPEIAPDGTAERNDALRRYWLDDRGGSVQLNRIYDAARDTGYNNLDQTEAAHVIPRAHGNWNLTREQWNVAGVDNLPDRRNALTWALGDVADDFLNGRRSMIKWGEVSSQFDGQEEVSAQLTRTAYSRRESQ